MSAPAFFAASAAAPSANTATRTVLPVPRGMTAVPRTVWSDFLASMPRLMDTSTDSSNLALAVLLIRVNTSSTG